MNPNLDWLNRLNSDSKGIWGIECPHGTSFDTDNILKMSSSNCEVAVFHVVKVDGIMKFRDSKQCNVNPDLHKIIERANAKAAENGCQSVRIVIADFHNSDDKEQCDLIKTARSIQESTTSISCQFVFCGRWSYFAFCSTYRQIHGHTSSPPAESKNMLHVPSWRTKETLDWLSEQRIMAVNPTEIDIVASDFLVEQTAGDEFLICSAVEYVGEQQGRWTSNIERTLSELISAPVVIEAINQRINLLEPHPKAELLKLLHIHYLVRGYDAIEAEQLWLAGLVQRRNLEGGKQLIQIAGPLINTVVRRILETEKPGTVVTPNHLCFEREAISTAAYRRIAQIENMLRNLIVSEWHIERGEQWPENLKKTKTPAYDRDEQEDLIKLVMFHVRSELVAMGISTESNIAESTIPVGSTGRQRQESLLDSAQNWQRRRHEGHAVELAHNNLMHFLTTESLVNVLKNKETGLFGDGKPFTKENLVAALCEYTEIRSAVAHNQPIKLSTISRLDGLQRKFIDWLTVFADRVVPE